MGQQIPATQREFLWYDYYLVTIQKYHEWPAGCTNPIDWPITCCVYGQSIIDYYAAGGDCNPNPGVWLCSVGSFGVILDIEGPFNYSDCTEIDG